MKKMGRRVVFVRRKKKDDWRNECQTPPPSVQDKSWRPPAKPKPPADTPPQPKGHYEGRTYLPD
jgi:hypothetical protein